METPSTVGIIGAGLVGLCTALEFQAQGQHVTLIDADEPGKGASFGNGGFIATELIDPLATPANLKRGINLLRDPDGALSIPSGNLGQSLPWLLRFALAARPKAVEKSRHALASLLREAVPAWQTLLTRHNLQQHLLPTHYLRVWESGLGQTDARHEQSFYRNWGIDAQFLDNKAVTDLEPALRDTINHALLLPHAHRVRDPFQLCQALLARFREAGGLLLQARVSAIRPANGLVTLDAGNREHRFSRVVLCAGVHSDRLLKPLGLRVPLMAERGYHLDLPGVQGLLKGPICSAERNVFISPLGEGLRIVGFSELGGTRLPPNPERYDSLRRHLGVVLPQTIPQLEHAGTWMGMRPTLPDSRPIIDTHPQHPQLGFVFGHQHTGVTLAALSAQLIAARMVQGTTPIDLKPFAADRFALSGALR
ncbi:MAG: FAD-binding oxidoreductase [Lautropia sp.]|nr:FAD-binding oxidoreductase [Lautropia sp.]